MPGQGNRPCDCHVGQANEGRAMGGCDGMEFSMELSKIACGNQIRSIRIVSISVFECDREGG